MVQRIKPRWPEINHVAQLKSGCRLGLIVVRAIEITKIVFFDQDQATSFDLTADELSYLVQF